MRLAFFCGSLEPGRDGVGDYTRRLAAECIRLGHPCVIVALNDLPVERPVFESQMVEDVSILVLRLSSLSPWNERIAEARQWIGAFHPDWMSLQFVCFGYHRRGLCSGLGKRLAAIHPTAVWQIMFHELWLGLEANASLKHRLWGALQRSIILDLVRRLHPRIIHTQTGAYQQVLRRENISASLLPLFGNISPEPGDAWEALLAPPVLAAVGGSPDRNQFYLAGVFGTVHPEWSAQKNVDLLLPLAQRAGRRLVLVFFGKNHLAPQALNQLKLTLRGQATVIALGEKSGPEISQILQTLDLGLATSSRQVIQKSGTVAAMLEHGLQVLVTRDDWRLAGSDFHSPAASPGLLLPDNLTGLTGLPVRNARSLAESGARTVAEKMTMAMKLRSPISAPVPV